MENHDKIFIPLGSDAPKLYACECGFSTNNFESIQFHHNHYSNNHDPITIDCSVPYKAGISKYLEACDYRNFQEKEPYWL